MNDVAILVPVLKRPHRVKPLLDSIGAVTTVPHRVLFHTDPDDWDEIAAISAAGGVHTGLPGGARGNYAQKINDGVRVTDEPLVFLGADDLHFHPGWFEAAAAMLSDTVGVVGTQDLCNPRVIAGEHATHFLVARWYAELGTIDEPGKLLHEGYPHELVDDEFVETAKHRGAYAFADAAVVEHLHPMVGKAPMDDLYAGQRHRMRRGRRIYERRRHLWT